jgi:hypothetical protein
MAVAGAVAEGTTLERLGQANGDIVAALEHAAAAIEILSSSDGQQLDAFRQHSDAFLERILSARAVITAHAHLMDELRDGMVSADEDGALLVYKTRLDPARQRLHLVQLLATSASDLLRSCMAGHTPPSHQ